MVFHPPGIVVEIVTTEAGDQGCTCKEHTVNCGEVLEEDMVVHLWQVQVVVDGREETAITAVLVTDGIDRCHVSFLKHHMIQHAVRFDGALAQMTVFLALIRARVTQQNAGCTTIIGGAAALQQSSPACLW
jgi:hypothetical protein